jgi:UDP-N-acetylglucosamine--N-acetylmuramyl-(pentapeptide) pyrophosphoryl-undecaprenol N-acetylglucosamine transferase
MKIFIVAGGTGGHLFPAIRVGEEIRLRGLGEILFITSCRMQDRDILHQKNITFTTVPIIPLQSRNIFSILNFMARLVAASLKSLFLLLRFRPKVVIGFGGYISGPILILASLLKMRTIIHEQNVYPGKANRILARFVDRIAVSFPEAKRYLRRYVSKIVVSGSPLRKELKRDAKTKDTFAPLETEGQSDGRKRSLTAFTILAMGGSQGAHTLNRLVPEALGLINGERKKELEVIHISGHKERDEVIKAYQDRGIKSKVFSFTEEIPRLYNECDFVISRAGAMTVSELLFLAKPSILIPYPYGGAHQHFNAAVLKDKGIAVLLEEQGLTPEILCDTLMRFMNKNVLSEMAGKAKDNSNMDPCDILIKEVVGG